MLRFKKKKNFIKQIDHILAMEIRRVAMNQLKIISTGISLFRDLTVSS